jgi:hypothetical protein
MMIWFNCCSIPQSTCTPAPYTSFYISTDNALNVINHDPTLSTLRGCIGTFGRASTQTVSKPHLKIPELCTPRLWDCRSLHDVESRRIWLVRLRRLDPANNFIQYMLCGANTKSLVCFAGELLRCLCAQACKRNIAIVLPGEHAFGILTRRCTITSNLTLAVHC